MLNTLNINNLPSPYNPNAGQTHPVALNRPTGKDFGDGTTGPTYPVPPTLPEFDLASVTKGLSFEQGSDQNPPDADGPPPNFKWSESGHMEAYAKMFGWYRANQMGLDSKFLYSWDPDTEILTGTKIP